MGKCESCGNDGALVVTFADGEAFGVCGTCAPGFQDLQLIGARVSFVDEPVPYTLEERVTRDLELDATAWARVRV